MLAYDLAFGPSPDQLSWHADHRRPGEAVKMPDARQAGWTGSAGPSIPVESWPRGSTTGLPMWHALTLELPEDYRARGEELVGIAFFQGQGQFAEEDEAVSAALAGVLDEDEADPFLRQLAETAGREHPQLVRLEDEIGGGFAVIWLTREELEGPRTAPPADPRAPGERTADDEGPNAWDSRGPEHLVWIGEQVGDVNAGRVPEERYGEPGDGPDAYREPEYELTGDPEHDAWVTFIATAGNGCHLGGTCYPMQAMPDLSPRYLELQEFGALNFGGGTAQYCLESDVFDWACG